jgi:hypothetical protein
VQTQKILIETLKTLPGMNMDIVEVMDDDTQQQKAKIPKVSSSKGRKNASEKPRKGAPENGS